MFLRRTTRKKNGKEHRSWSLVENRRRADGRVAQRHVLYWGQISDSQEQAWRKSIQVFTDPESPPATLSLFPGDRATAKVDDAPVVHLRLSELAVCRPRQWGAGWLLLPLWQELGRDRFWAERLPPSRKGTRWDWVWATLAASRLISPGRARGACLGNGWAAVPWPICWGRTFP